MSKILETTYEVYAAETMYDFVRKKNENLKFQLSNLVDEINKMNPKFFASTMTESAKTASEHNLQKEETLHQNKSKYAKGEEKLKTLWRKIAASCHPDKTDDEKKHSAFVAAQQAKDNLDLQTMEKIAATLDGSFTPEDRLEILRKLISELNAENQRLTESNLYNFLLFQQNRPDQFKHFVKNWGK